MSKPDPVSAARQRIEKFRMLGMGRKTVCFNSDEVEELLAIIEDLRQQLERRANGRDAEV